MNPANSMVSPASRISTARRPLLIIGASRPPSPGGPSPNRGRLTGTRRMGIAAVDCAISVKSYYPDYRDQHQQHDDSQQNDAEFSIAVFPGRVYRSHDCRTRIQILSNTITNSSAGK